MTPTTLKELTGFIQKEDQRLREKYSNYPDEEKRVLSRTVKLTEELGELCNEVLASQSQQRQEKLAQHQEDNLSEEFADVLITTLLLANCLGVDIEEALARKIAKIEKRYKVKATG